MRATTRQLFLRSGLTACGLLVAGPILSHLADGVARGQDVSRNLPAPYVTRQSDVEVPFSVKPGTTPDSQPASVRVFVSWDQGKSWHFLDERKPADGRFRFQPKQDGEYWFATQTVDRSGRTDSGQPKRPQLRLVIDTEKPQLLAQATVGQASDVTLTFSAADPTLQPATLKIEYQDAAVNGPWLPVEIDPKSAQNATGQSTGRAVFKPQVAGQSINVRAEVADSAGNIAYFTQRLSLVPPKPKLAAAAGGPATDPSATRWSENPFVTSHLPEENAAEDAPEPNAIAESPPDQPQEIQPQEIRNDGGEMENVVQNPYALQVSAASSNRVGAANRAGAGLTGQREQELTPPTEELPAPPSSTSPPSSEFESPSVQTPYSPPTYSQPTPADTSLPSPAVSSSPREPAPTYNSPTIVRSSPGYESIPTESTPALAPNTSPVVETVDAPSGQRPRLTNQRRFSLDYDVESVGPEGLADVELWGTSDGGRTWVKWGADPDRQTPFDVEVNNEASYGFRVVIVGKSGLASNAPRPGDTADIWVGIDLTRPSAQLTSAAYGQGAAAGKLDIRWKAADPNLASRPITLSIADRPDGAFAPIAAGLPNSGHYFWEFDPRSPRQIYLRLEVRDEAGNVAVDQLTEPILVEGLQPKGRIRGFSSNP